MQHLDPTEALAHWRRAGELRPVDGGLINRTWTVGKPPSAVLQWVNPIFAPEIHLDIVAAVCCLAAAGVGVPRLLPAPDGRLWIDAAPGCWRLQTYLPGTTIHRLTDPRQAASAGALVGRAHTALAGFAGECQAPRRRIHDTLARMAELEEALAGCDQHPLAGAAREVGAEILAAWARWDGELDLPERVCHGDLKVSNLRFDAAGREAVALLDLDTIEPMPLAAELGDAWRSWCNPAGEDRPEDSRFDAGLFAAAAAAWRAAGPPLEEREVRSLVPGIERIALELAARFTADAVRNCYFLENRQRWPQAGVHNLVRARGQLALARSVREQRPALDNVLGVLG